MAVPAGERITFSLDDPARAIQQAVLGPLVHATLPTLDVGERLAGMLVHLPSAGVTPQLPDAFRRARHCLESWRTATGNDSFNGPSDSGLTGSVSIELATSDPLTALRQDIFEPLLRRVADSLRRIEAITAVLLAAPEPARPAGVHPDPAHPDRTPPGIGSPGIGSPGIGSPGIGSPGIGSPGSRELAAVRSAVRDLAAHVEQYDAAAAASLAGGAAQSSSQHDPRGRAAAAPGSAAPLTGLAAPSLRSAVERAVTSFPSPFTGRDVLLALDRDAYQEPAKSVSNALSAMVKAGRLRRISRGTYAVVTPSDDALAARS